jgi:serine/threonine protein kinase/Tol biopolymer transport system component
MAATRDDERGTGVTPERWRRLEDLFHDARECAPEDRAAFLAVACNDDVALRREVELLLNQEDDGLLRDGLAGAAASVMPPTRGHHEGTVLGSYILGPLLGTGAIGDVYKARDTKLGRDVAVKILPDILSQHPARLARFEREARILAALNHPNIAAIYGVEETNSIRALVLELVDGVTLAEKLRAGETERDSTPLPMDEALGIATEIAEALEAAHQKGVVHRDLKPANIKITPNGVVKVLDFGLAKIQVTDSSEPAAIPVLATSEGTVLGTVAYMSPEQARGQPVDKRTDIWAFGCVLYEMLAGYRPFPGSSSADVLATITTAEPDWTRLPSNTPRGVRDVLRRCLTKDPERRLHDIADARIEIEDARTSDERVSDTVDLRSISRGWRSLAPWLLSGVTAIVAAIALWFAPSATPREARSLVRVSIALPPDVSLYAIGRGSSVALSPDGQRLVYVGIVDGRTQLYMRRLAESDSVAIAGTEGAANPFFSPDGLWIGFTAGTPTGPLKRIPVQGGAVLSVIDEAPAASGFGFSVQGAAWGPDDTILFTATNPAARGLWRVAASGGTAQRVTTPREGEQLHSWPQTLPDGKSVLYTIWNITGFDGGRIAVQPIDGGEPMILVERAGYGRVVSLDDRRGYLVYARPEGLLAARFDLDQRRLTGPAMPVVDGVATNLSGGAHYSVSSGGLLAYIPGKLDEVDKTLLWVGRDGTATEITTISGFSFQYRLSPDGRRVVRPNTDGVSRDLWVDDLERRGTPMRLTFGGVHNVPIWTADGKRVIYSSGVPNENLFWRAADGSGDEERLTTSANRHIAGSVSHDGTLLAYIDADVASGGDIWLLPLREPRRPRRFLSTPFGERHPTFSPNGRWLAYTSNMSGQFEVYVCSLADERRQIPVSKGGGYIPLWSPDGRELYYRSVDPTQGGNMMAVSVDISGPEPKIGAPRVLFASPYQGTGDIAPDGRFLLVKRTPQESPSRFIELVFNWFGELQEKVPLP